MLGTKLVALEKKKGEYIYREKYKEEKKKKRILLFRFHQRVDLTASMVQSS